MLHRLAYIKANGLSIDEINGLVVRHKCDNPRCYNPDHLELGTYADNSIDMVLRGRSTKGERNPMAKLTNKQVEEIRHEYSLGSITQRSIAKKFGISFALTCLIINKKIWN